MARIEHSRRGKFIIPESGDEMALIAHGARHGNTLVLLEAYYTVHGLVLVLPELSDVNASQRVCSAFEHAAVSHRRAVLRRKKFTLVND